MSALVRINGIHKYYTRGSERIDVLKGVNLEIPPTAPANQRRLTVLSSAPDATFGCVSSVSLADPAGFPNGRRPNDDVTDVALRVVAGVLRGPVPCLGDGVNVKRVRRLWRAEGVGVPSGS